MGGAQALLVPELCIMNQIMRPRTRQAISGHQTAIPYETGHVAVPKGPAHKQPALAANYSAGKAGAILPGHSEQVEPGLDQPLMGIEELRGFAGCSDYGDHEATAVLDSLHTLAQILVDTFAFTPIRKEAA